MTLDVHGKQTVTWQAPKTLPDGMTCVSVTIGPDPANMGLEIAQAVWSRHTAPAREAMASLHASRLAKRLSPVVVAAVGPDDDVWLFGPLPDGQVIGPLPGDHATRLLQSALDQPNGLLARHRLAALYDALATTGLPGVANAGLFATNDLQRGARRRGDWGAATETSTKLLGLRRHDLLEALGYRLEANGDATVLTTATSPPRAVAVLLEDDESFDAGSARFTVSPVAYGLSAATRHNVPWLIVTRGSQVRLYPARPHVGVGRKGQAETYFEVDLALLTHDTAGFLTLAFSGAALREGGSVDELLTASAQYAVALGERLRTKVYDDVVPSLSVAVAEALRATGREMDRAGLDLAYQLTLRTFFRILFQAYAEDRKLLPYGENTIFDRHAVNTLAGEFTDFPDLPFDTSSTSLWDGLAQMWRVIDKGDDAWSMPAYNGGLFSSDPELHPTGALLEKITVTNDVLGPALRALLVDTDDSGVTGPVDFRSLSVREFGTIYEGLLESNLALADVDLTLGKNDTWLPAKPGDEVVAPAGTVYFHNTSGQRKGTGSYFTPSFVVEHLLERALDPSLDAHLSRIAALLDSHDTTGAAAAFFDFRVADLAMGSGHFLTAAIDHIESKMAAFLEHHPIPGVADELRRLEEAARDATGPDSPAIEPSSLLRRQVARRCIYGLDINTVAVELARVSIWIHTFVRGLPMSSLDHNLVCANSLTGIGSVDEALDVLVPKRAGGQLTVFDAPIEAALDAARDVLTDVAAAAEATWQDAQDATRAAQQALDEAETARLLFDAAVLRRIGRAELVRGEEPEQIAEMAGRAAAQDAAAELRPAHFPYLFPEVFLRERPGFDVLIGNPPWEKLKVERHQWWWLRFPGLRALPPGKRTSEIARLETTRPDLLREFESDVEASEYIRQVLVGGPFPGIGSGHIDLYKAFAWRNWHLVRELGRTGTVLPRAAFTGAGTEAWRREVLEHGSFPSVCTATNRREWIFRGVHASQPVAFVVAERGGSTRQVGLGGPFTTAREFADGSQSLGVVETDELLSWSSTALFPQLDGPGSATIFRLLRHALEFRTTGFRPVIELRPVEDKGRINTDIEHPGGPIPIATGASFNLWDPDFGPPYGYGQDSLLDHLLKKSRKSARLARSPFHGMNFPGIQDLPVSQARIAFRDVTKYDNSRGVIACLLPPGVAVMHAAPYLLHVGGEERERERERKRSSSVPSAASRSTGTPDGSSSCISRLNCWGRCRFHNPTETTRGGRGSSRSPGGWLRSTTGTRPGPRRSVSRLGRCPRPRSPN